MHMCTKLSLGCMKRIDENARAKNAFKNILDGVHGSMLLSNISINVLFSAMLLTAV